jgi:hypothetical protein
MRRVRQKLTFANVMSVIAVFIALGGVGYAASRLPKNSVGPKQIRNGAVNEAKLSASAKASLTGAKGDQGPQGPTGPKGPKGPAGPGATSFATTLSQGTTLAAIATTSNGLTVQGSCLTGPSTVVLKIKTTSGANNIQVSGTVNTGPLATAPEDSDGPFGAVQTSDPNLVDFDVLARDKTVGPFARLDVHAKFGSPCTYWGMITPSA